MISHISSASPYLVHQFPKMEDHFVVSALKPEIIIAIGNEIFLGFCQRQILGKMYFRQALS